MSKRQPCLIKNSQYKNSPNTEFINRFMGMKCAVDLLRLGMFPNAKEITESLGMFAACQHLPEEFSRDNATINVVSIGDGRTPRTAALFAFLTRWNCISIDPILKETVYPINRFKAYKKKIEDIVLYFDGPVIIICCHSHARLFDCDYSVRGKNRWLINMPCCVKPNLPVEPTVEYVENRVWSPMNKIAIYKLKDN